MQILDEKQTAVWERLLKLRTHPACDPAAPRLGIYPGEMKTHVPKERLAKIVCNSLIYNLTSINM